MAKKIVEGIVSEFKKLLADDRLVLGGERTLKLLRDKKVERVFFASDVSDIFKERIVHQCDVLGVPFESLSKSAEEVGVICRKPFRIAVVGVLA